MPTSEGKKQGRGKDLSNLGLKGICYQPHLVIGGASQWQTIVRKGLMIRAEVIAFIQGEGA
jgi:hypothetical protein